MSENTVEDSRSFDTAHSSLNRLCSIHITVPDDKLLIDTMSSKLFNPNRSTVLDANLESSDTSSEDEISRNNPLELLNWPVYSSRTAEKVHKACLKRNSAPAKPERCPLKDFTGTANKFRKLPLKRISGESKSNSRITNNPKMFNDRFITYDPYLQKQRSSGNYSLVNLQELGMLNNLESPNISTNKEANMELQNSFISAQRRHYLNQKDKI